MFAQMHMGSYLQLWSTSQILANYVCSAMVHPADTKANTENISYIVFVHSPGVIYSLFKLHNPYFLLCLQVSAEFL